MRTLGSAEVLERFRRQAVAAVQDGQSQADVARVLGVNKASVSRWVTKVEEHGGNLDALAAKPRPVKRLLSPDNERLLADLLAQGAHAHGWPNDLWTAARVRVLILKKFQIDFHVEYVRTILKKRLNFSSQRPQVQAKKRDAAAVERWKSDTFEPFLKASPGRKGNAVLPG